MLAISSGTTGTFGTVNASHTPTITPQTTNAAP
jgi:hypothetical protein